MSQANKYRDRKRLRNLKVSRIDLVDRGANQDAHIVYWKSDVTKCDYCPAPAEFSALVESAGRPVEIPTCTPCSWRLELPSYQLAKRHGLS